MHAAARIAPTVSVRALDWEERGVEGQDRGGRGGGVGWGRTRRWERRLGSRGSAPAPRRVGTREMIDDEKGGADDSDDPGISSSSKPGMPRVKRNTAKSSSCCAALGIVSARGATRTSGRDEGAHAATTTSTPRRSMRSAASPLARSSPRASWCDVIRKRDSEKRVLVLRVPARLVHTATRASSSPSCASACLTPHERCQLCL